MKKSIFKPIKIGGATAVLALTSLLSYGIGLFRDRIIAVNFGTSAATDTYNASFLVPDLLFNLFIMGALTAAFLPVFTEHLVKNKKEAHEIANTMLTSATILISILAAIAFVFMESIVPLLFTTANPQMQTDIINMTRMMLPSAIIFAISNTLGNILMSYKHFIAYAISPILYNFGIILGVIFLNESIGIYSAASGVLIGASLHALIRIIDTLNTDYKFKPKLNVKSAAFKKIIKLMIPKSISLIAWQINLYIFALIGIKLINGGLAAFHFARNIQSFAVSLFGIAFATAVFPYLAASASENNQKGFTDHMQKTIQRILFFTIPAMAGVMLMSSELVEIILSGGAFNENSVKLTSIILFYFAVSIPFESLSHILARGFYAHQNTVTPMLVNVGSMTLIALSTIFLAPKYGIEWFSIGFSLGFVVYISVMTFLLRKKLKGFDIREFIKSTCKTIIATLIMAMIILILKPLEENIGEMASHLARVAIGGASFFVAAIALKSNEISSIKYILDKALRKNEA